MEQGLTQEALAERAGVSVNPISALERGERQGPRRSTVELLATALELSGAERAAFFDAFDAMRRLDARSAVPLDPTASALSPDVCPYRGLQPSTRITPRSSSGATTTSSGCREAGSRADPGCARPVGQRQVVVGPGWARPRAAEGRAARAVLVAHIHPGAGRASARGPGRAPGAPHAQRAHGHHARRAVSRRAHLAPHRGARWPTDRRPRAWCGSSTRARRSSRCAATSRSGTEFLANLLYATAVPDGRCSVVLTLRADFYARCQRIPTWRGGLTRSSSW